VHCGGDSPCTCFPHTLWDEREKKRNSKNKKQTETNGENETNAKK